MVIWRSLGAVSLMVGAIVSPPALAQTDTLPDNATFFTGQPPSLVDTDTPYNSTNIPNARYYFLLALPAGAIQSLGQISIHQQPNPDPIDFDLTRTEVFMGTPQQPGAALPYQVSNPSGDASTIVITLDPPLAPGNEITVGLLAEQNPSVDGTYQFRVQAFPAGTSPVGMDLGVGRLQFYNLR